MCEGAGWLQLQPCPVPICAATEGGRREGDACPMLAHYHHHHHHHRSTGWQSGRLSERCQTLRPLQPSSRLRRLTVKEAGERRPQSGKNSPRKPPWFLSGRTVTAAVSGLCQLATQWPRCLSQARRTPRRPRPRLRGRSCRRKDPPSVGSQILRRSSRRLQCTSSRR